MKTLLREFREFALRGNFIDIAIGMLIGAGMTPIASSLINDIIMPPIGFLLGQADLTNLYFIVKQGSPPGPYLTLDAAATAGAITIKYGNFLNKILSFLTVAFIAFLMVKSMNKLKKEAEETGSTKEENTKVCKYCLSVIPLKASKCAHCTTSQFN